MKKKLVGYELMDLEQCSDLIGEPQFELFFNNGQNERSEADTLRVLSLFSGCGGMDLGFEGGFICHRDSVGDNSWINHSINDDWIMLRRNKFRTVFACDILEEAQLTWLNYMSRFHINPDIYHLESIVDLVKMHKAGMNIFPKNVDVVTGGFPCQDFSVAGKRKGFGSNVSHNGKKVSESDNNTENRGNLYLWMKQVIDIVQPKMFVAENVKGLVSLGNVKDIIRKDFSLAGDNGYIVLEPQILNAGNYGVPEMRERVIFIGIKKSALKQEALVALSKKNVSKEYSPYPKPTHNYTVGNDTLKKPVICKDVLGKLMEPDDTTDLSQKHFSCAKFLETGGQGQSEININGIGPTIRSEHHGNIEYRRLSKQHGGKIINELESGMKERRLTPRECALIQSFPPDYPFVCHKRNSSMYAVSPTGAYKVIGNAVPPMLAYNIARRIQEIWPIYF